MREMTPEVLARRIIAIVDKHAMPWNRQEMADEILALLFDVMHDQLTRDSQAFTGVIDRLVSQEQP